MTDSLCRKQTLADLLIPCVNGQFSQGWAVCIFIFSAIKPYIELSALKGVTHMPESAVNYVKVFFYLKTRCFKVLSVISNNPEIYIFSFSALTYICRYSLWGIVKGRSAQCQKKKKSHI